MQNQPQDKLPWWHVLQSVLSAMIGVQSKKRARKDFDQGNFKIYAAVGVVAVIVFILVIVAAVKLVIS